MAPRDVLKHDDSSSSSPQRAASPPARVSSDDEDVHEKVRFPSPMQQNDSQPAVDVVVPPGDLASQLDPAYFQHEQSWQPPPGPPPSSYGGDLATYPVSSEQDPPKDLGLLRDPMALLEAGLIFDPEYALYDIKFSISAQVTEPGGHSAGNSSAGAVDGELRKFTLEDFQAAKPYPTAFFCPSTMQWTIIAPAEDFITNPQYSNSSPIEAMPLYDSSTETLLSAADQRRPIDVQNWQEGQSKRTARPHESPFRLHCDEKRYSYLVSSTIPSALEGKALAGFRHNRRSSPLPGQSADDAFTNATKVLVRILANASRGDSRKLPLASNTIRKKLGYDEHIESIFHSAGMRKTTLDDGSDAMIACSSDEHLTLRVLIELIVWFNHNKPSYDSDLKLASVGFSAVVDRVNERQFAEHFLGWRPVFETKQYSAPMTQALKDALKALGCCEMLDDQLLETVYNANMARRSRDRTSLFSALETILQSQRPDSPILQTLYATEQSRGRFNVSTLRQAYRSLGLGTGLDVPELDVQVIVTQYKSHIEETTRQGSYEARKDTKRALEIICADLGDPRELVHALNEPMEMTPKEAEEALGLTENPDQVEDSMVITLFQIHATDHPSKVDHYREALAVLAKARNSSMLKNFHSTGEKEEEGMGISTLPAGVNNIGNTCYLNSVFQYFFALRPLREQVLHAKATSIDAVVAANRRVGGRIVSHGEVQRSRKFVTLLAQLFDAMITTPALAVTPEKELAFLALVSSRAEEQEQPAGDIEATSTPIDSSTELTEQSRMETSPERATEPRAQDADIAGEPSASSTVPALPPRPVKNLAVPTTGTSTPTSQGARRNSLMRLGAQQDVSECLDNVLFQVDVALGKSDEAEISKLFTGRTIQRVESLQPSTGSGAPGALQRSSQSTHVKEEIFTILPIDVVEEGRDIYDGLDGFFEEETLTGEGGQAVKRSVSLLEAPPILQIQLQRVQYDRVRGVYKSQAHLEMGESLYMDRYLDFSDAKTSALSQEKAAKLAEKRRQTLMLRKQIGEYRERIATLKPPVGPSAQQSLKESATVLKGLSALQPLSSHPAFQDESGAGAPSDLDLSSLVTPDFVTFLQRESSAIAAEIKSLQTMLTSLKSQCEALWASEQSLEYKLMSVFVHRGEALHGHYFLHQKKTSSSSSFSDADGRESTWFKYNDSLVSEVHLQEVLKDTSGATPYLLCYVRKDLQDEYHHQNDAAAANAATAATVAGDRRIFETLRRDLGGQVTSANANGAVGLVHGSTSGFSTPQPFPVDPAPQQVNGEGEEQVMALSTPTPPALATAEESLSSEDRLQEKLDGPGAGAEAAEAAAEDTNVAVEPAEEVVIEGGQRESKRSKQDD